MPEFQGVGPRIRERLLALNYVRPDGQPDVRNFCLDHRYERTLFYDWLMDRRTPTKERDKLCRDLGVDAAWLLLGVHVMPPTPEVPPPPRRGRGRPQPIAGGSGATASAPADPGPLAMGPEAPRASDKRHSLSRFLRFLQHFHRGWGVGTPATPLAYGH